MGEYNQELLNYIKQELKHGSSITHIKETLLLQGWVEAEVNDTIVEAQVELEKEKVEQKEKEKEQKANLGFSISLIGGLLMLIDALFAFIIMNFTPIFALSALYTIPIPQWTPIVFAALVILGSIIIRPKPVAGSVIVLIFSVFNILFVSTNIGTIIAIIGGVLGSLKK